MPKKPYSRPETPNRGAADERAQWMKKLRRMWDDPKLDSASAGTVLSSLFAFGAGRTERDNARDKGLGRTFKVKPTGRKVNKTGQDKRG